MTTLAANVHLQYPPLNISCNSSLTTLLIVVGGILPTAANGPTTNGMFWMLIVHSIPSQLTKVARGIVGFGAGGEHPASSISASEAANEHTLKHRGPVFILVTNLPRFWRSLRIDCIHHRPQCRRGTTSLHNLACMYGNRMYLASHNLLLSSKNAQFKTLPSRNN